MEKTYIGDQMIPAGAANNPYGQWWIDLEATPASMAAPPPDQTGPSALHQPQPAGRPDIAAILTVGARS